MVLILVKISVYRQKYCLSIALTFMRKERKKRFLRIKALIVFEIHGFACFLLLTAKMLIYFFNSRNKFDKNKVNIFTT